MLGKNKQTVFWVTAVAAVADMVFGALLPNLYLVGAGGCVLCYVGFRLGRQAGSKPADEPPPETAPAPPPVAAAVRFPASPDQPESLIRQMLAQGRYALLLRPQIAGSLEEEAFAEAVEALQQWMALVPNGEVVLGRIDEALDDGKLDEEEIAAHRGRVVAVDRFFLDRHPVTNRQFFEFVAAGAYEQAALWDPSVLPAVLDFVDQSGRPGPRFWRDGCYPPGRQQHPVVGICWHEAMAYARWVGKRLPTDAEWVKAAAWPVQVSAATRLQRKYPWGETMDRGRANLWGSGPASTVPVEEFPDGVSVGGVHQLIGNVWEWTGGNFRTGDHPEGMLVLEAPMKSIRGGAFDTYFDNQATCQFQSGEGMLVRKHNIGFRCAVGVCDLMLARAEPSAASAASADQPQDLPAEEVPV
jgi:iron(II)-dependent oxidoreductase